MSPEQKQAVLNALADDGVFSELMKAFDWLGWARHTPNNTSRHLAEVRKRISEITKIEFMEYT